MYVQIKACRVNPVSFKGKMNYALKEANDAKLAQKQDKGHVIYLKEKTDKTILKLATLKISTNLNMQRLREEHDEALNFSKDNGTTETIEELDKLCQTIENKMWFLQFILLVILALYHHMYQV